MKVETEYPGVEWALTPFRYMGRTQWSWAVSSTLPGTYGWLLDSGCCEFRDDAERDARAAASKSSEEAIRKGRVDGE